MSQFRGLSDARNQYMLGKKEVNRLGYPSASCSSVPTAFRSPLASILNPGRMLVEFHTISQNQVAAALYKHEITRVVCLLHIHTMLWVHRDDKLQTDTYMWRIVKEVRRNGLASSKSLDALSWVLVWLCLSDNSSDSEEIKIGWKEITRMVLRLLRVALRLRPRNWQYLEYTMFESLVGTAQSPIQGEADSPSSHATSRERNHWLDPEEVWKDVMSQ